MDRNREFLTNINITDIPWHRIVTTYGRATDFPLYFDALMGTEISEVNNALKELEWNIEHQSTLYPATPFTVIFLVRIFDKAIEDISKNLNHHVVLKLLDIFIIIQESIRMFEVIERADPLPLFEDMLEERYLWSEEYDEEEDEARYEEEGGPFPDNLFYSFYYYTDEVLKSYKDELQKYLNLDDKEVVNKLKQLLSLIS